MITVRPNTRSAYSLFHEGSLALAEAEFNGIRCDRGYIQRMIRGLNREISSLKSSIADTELGKVWNNRYGASTKYGSDTQLRQVLYKDMGLESDKVTAKGLVSVDSEVLGRMGRDDIGLLLRMRSLEKNCNTFLKGLLRESEADGFIHPFFHLSSYDDDKDGGARSFRGSSSDPNFQNFPNRHDEDRKLIRSAFLPRSGHRLVSRDYGSMEVRVSACLHQDPNMIRYIEQGDDMHRDCASRCFSLPPEMCTKKYGEVGKNIRFVGKNRFVFAQFYFQDPSNSAKGLWKSMMDMDLRHPEDPDKPMAEHLKDKGIRNFDSFDRHVQGVCRWFWEEMFPGFGRWRNKWVADYEKKGYFDMVTGFRVEGVMSKYQLGNYPIQGPAFHCLLWSMVEVNKLWQGVKSKIVGQIHDELTTDEHASEFRRNQHVVPSIMAHRIRKEWDWIIVPLEVETEATDVDQPWYYKKGV